MEYKSDRSDAVWIQISINISVAYLNKRGIWELTVVFLDISKYTTRELRQKGIKALHSPDTEIDDYSTQIDLIGQ